MYSALCSKGLEFSKRELMDRKEPCQCDTFGFCDRYLKEVTELERNLCQEREDYRESFYRLSLDRINLNQ